MYSRTVFNISCGIPSSSQKNERVLVSKKRERKGEKIRFPMGESHERGSPHATIMGRDTSVRKRLRIKKSISATCSWCITFIIPYDTGFIGLEQLYIVFFEVSTNFGIGF